MVEPGISSKKEPPAGSHARGRASRTHFGHKLFLITGNSGAGKTTISSYLLNKLPLLKRVVTCTTRPMREGERDGVDYHFISKEKFDEYLKTDALLEHAAVYNNYYGSLRSEVQKIIDSGKSALMTVDIKGAFYIKKRFEPTVLIFVKTPDLDVLRERLMKRGLDSPEEIETRMTIAVSELLQAEKCDYVLVNDKLEDTFEKAESIFSEEMSGE